VQHIAVIDDDLLICNIIVDVLGNTGAAVQCATSGRSGRRLLTGKCFDLAIIDVVLPDASGLALAAIAANENTPVLLITDRPNVTARLKRYDLADFPCLLKPFDLVRLRTETEQAVAESQQNVRRIKEGMAGWRASIIALDDAMADARQLIAASHRLYGQSDGAQLPTCPMVAKSVIISE
jgi:DNA-binding NtrC family response regulator